MTFRTGKNFLFLLLLTILPGLSCLTAAPAIPESVQSYVVVDTGKLLESTQFSRFEKIWENGVFFIDTLRNEAAKYHFELNDLQPYAVLVINWEKHDDSIVLIEFPEPVKERLLSTAAEMPDLFTVLNAPDARIMVKDNVASESEIDYVIAFLDGKQIIAGRKLILDTWLKEYSGQQLKDTTIAGIAYCKLKLPEKSGSDFVDLMFGGVKDIEATLAADSEKIVFTSIWRGTKIKDIQAALNAVYNLGIGMLFGGSPEVAAELRMAPQITVIDNAVHFDLEISDELFERILQALLKNFEQQKYMFEYDEEGW